MTQKQSTVALEDLQSLQLELTELQSQLDLTKHLVADNERLVTQQESKLTTLATKEAEHKANIDALETREQELDDMYKLKVQAYKSDLKQERDKVIATKAELPLVNKQLRAVEDMITERARYQLEQETHIKEMTESGNAQLRNTDYDISLANQALKDIKLDISSFIRDKSMLEHDLEQIRADFGREEADHKNSIDTITEDIAVCLEKKAQLEKQITTASEKLATTNQNINAKIQQLGVTERAVMAKREALASEKQEMEEKRHYWSSPESLYGVE